jgi:hypothetical protein
MARKPYNPPTTEVEEGKWYALDNPEATICCECELVHHTEYQLFQGRLMFRTKVDRALTDRRRKQHGVTISRKP